MIESTNGKSRAPDKHATFRTTNLHKQDSIAVNPLSTGSSQNRVTSAIPEQTTVCLSHVRRNQLSPHSGVCPGTGSVVDRWHPDVLVLNCIWQKG